MLPVGIMSTGRNVPSIRVLSSDLDVRFGLPIGTIERAPAQIAGRGSLPLRLNLAVRQVRPARGHRVLLFGHGAGPTLGIIALVY
ncbi:hypothetical protein WJ63_36915 [Burkholderia pyrrocinia]|nr:hypothetical protein WJ63_36915 [Burkholderia pyrrocinia]